MRRGVVRGESRRGGRGAAGRGERLRSLQERVEHLGRRLQRLEERVGAELGRIGPDIRRSAARYEAVFHQGVAGVAEVDLSARFMAVNDRFCEICGHSHEALSGKSVWEVTDPRDQLANQRRFERLLREGRDFAIQKRYIRADGSRTWIDASVSAVLDEQGEVRSALWLVQDISKRKRAEEELRRSEAGLAEAQRIAHVGSWEVEVIDPEDQLRGEARWSREVFRIMGLESDDEPAVIGESRWVRRPMSHREFLEIVHPEDREAVLTTVREAIHGGGHYDLEHRIVRPDGTVRIVQEQAEIERDAEGRALRLFGTIQDITDRKRVEAELERHRDHLAELVAQRTAELEASQQRLRLGERMAAMGTLAAGLGHDMGNILVPIRVRLESLEGTELPASAREDVEALRQAADYLQRLTRGLRLLSLDPEAGDPASEETELAGWCEDVGPMLKNALPPGTTLECHVNGGSEGVRLPRIGVSRHGLTQAVFNLVQNAGEALRASGKRGHVAVSADLRDDGRIVQVRVADNGPGMTPETRTRCLEPFYTTKPRMRGTGLGLALVHVIVQRAGGSVEIDSELGRGTTFILNLPVREAARPGTHGGTGPHAIVSVAEPRISALAGFILKNLGMDVTHRRDVADENVRLWVVDDGERDPSQLATDVRHLLASWNGDVQVEPSRMVVLLGRWPDGPVPDGVVELGERPRLAEVRKALIAAAWACGIRTNHKSG